MGSSYLTKKHLINKKCPFCKSENVYEFIWTDKMAHEKKPIMKQYFIKCEHCDRTGWAKDNSEDAFSVWQFKDINKNDWI